ncbi:MAG: ATP-dependent RecD-like DNA helicase [Lachnospiraceae bacterium]|nr:ATP-dependent RecD-like DNA helicase [Lachnospiraceae bacterium]
MEILKGYIDHFIFQNEENGFTVAEVIVEGEPHVCVGLMRGFSEGETVEMEGEYTVHPKYLEQFKISGIKAVPPEDKLSLMRYLGSGAIKGIGNALAQRIVDHFGEDTFRIIEEEPERLAEIKGISQKKAREIAEQLVEKREMRNAALFLQQYGIGQNLADKIYRQYGNEVYQVIRENPYRMVEDIQGVGFKIADEIASHAGIRVDSDYRIRCGIIYVLYQQTIEGNCYYPRELLLDKTAQLLGLESEQITGQLMSLAMDQQVLLKKIKDEERVYPASYYKEEMTCARKLLELRDSYEYPVSQISDQKIMERIVAIEASMEMNLDGLQREAVAACIKNGVFILSGGPGTGKTTTINAILKYLEAEQMDFVLAAPTGRAAKRMTETTGYEAKTIHRLLEISGEIAGEGHRSNFERNEDNPLEVDAVVVDEVSMVDIHLLRALLAALIPGTKLILIGDVSQLPSVGPGQILKDIIDSGRFACVMLEKIFRQAAESHIVSYAHKINKGEPIDFSQKYRDFFLLDKDRPEVIYQYIEALVKDKVPKEFQIEPLEAQILTPMRKGPLGSEELNRVFQERLNPPSPEKKEFQYGDTLFRVGDKIMQIKNDYDLKWEIVGNYNITIADGTGVFNGDIGTIRDIDDFSKILKVCFDDGKLVDYTFQELDELEHAYAITIHKSQGSEYPVIILPILNGPKMLLNRNLLYTGVTRARDCVIILGNPDTVLRMISADAVQKRYTSLNERLMEMDMGRI